MAGFVATLPRQSLIPETSSSAIRQIMLIVNGLDCPAQATQTALEITAQSGGCLTVLYLTPPEHYKYWCSSVEVRPVQSEDSWQHLKSYFLAQARHYKLLPSQIVFEKGEFQKLAGLEEIARQKRTDLVILACHQWPCKMWLVS